MYLVSRLEFVSPPHSILSTLALQHPASPGSICNAKRLSTLQQIGVHDVGDDHDEEYQWQ